MSSKTKIVVLKSRELIYTGIFILLGIMLILLLFYMFSPEDKNKGEQESGMSTGTNVEEDNSLDTLPSTTTQSTGTTTGEEIRETMSSYVPGVYTSELNLGGSPLQLSVTVDKNHVTGVTIDNLDDTITAMYPLISPSIDEINSQIGMVSSIEDITYSSDNKYTTIIILEAIDEALEDAKK